MADSYTGGCFCGAVTVEVRGEPAVMGYCHCTSCRTWSASPVNAFVLWKPEQVSVTKGEDKIGTYAKTEMSHRQFCTDCGGHVMARHPPLGLVDVFSAVTPGLTHKPVAHVNYGEAVLPMRDGLPKFKDFPEEFGGSGEMVAE